LTGIDNPVRFTGNSSLYAILDNANLYSYTAEIHEKENRMKSIFSLDSPVIRFLNLTADLILLNMLWVLCSIPVITIGASTTAMYRVTLNMQESRGTIIKSFFTAFRQNFRQATILWLIFAAAGAFLVIDYAILYSTAFTGKALVFVLFALTVIFYLMTFTCVFPLAAHFENTTKNMIRNAFQIAVGHFFQIIIMTAFNLLPVIIFLFKPGYVLYIGFVCLLIAVSFIAFINSQQFTRIFAGLKTTGEEETPE